jgi:hypothetical protein
MNVGLAFRQLSHHARQEGVLGIPRWLWRGVQWRVQEWRYGIRTEAVIETAELGIQNREAGEYQPTDYTDFPKIVAALGVEPKEHVFVDYGAGMGRAVILAAGYPFRRIVGIEYSEVLSKVALGNIENCRDKLECAAIEIITGDAADYALPEDASVLYFRNPFFGQSLERVLDNIRAHAVRTANPLLLACNLPATSPFEEQLRRHDWLEVKEYLPLNDFRHCLIFRTKVAVRAGLAA